MGRPIFTKYHKNIELKYRANRNAWTVIDHEKTGQKTILIAYVDAECPEHIQGQTSQEIFLLETPCFKKNFKKPL